MIILDTSIWIEFLKGNSQYTSKVKSLLENREILAVECIFAELLQGTNNDRERSLILSYWNHLPKLNDNGLFIEAGLFSGKNKLLDKGVGLIDSLIYIHAMKTGSMIWTLDKKLTRIISDKQIYKP
ncbi:MAG: PIN domain-containing protein [Spirochaetales bacterium]|nr:PIN domain-containing protein [Spirochaetales bacterium]